MKKTKKIKRILSIPIKLTEETGTTITLQIIDGKYTFIDSFGKKLPLTEGISTIYQGENKTKTVNTVFADSFHLDSTHAVSEYERLIIVDTNTKKINNLNVLIGVMILCDIKVNNDSYQITPTNILTDCFPHDFSFQPNNPFPFQSENFIWSKFLSILRDKCENSFKSKTVMIVDSDLGNLSKYNEYNTKFYNGLIYPCINPVLVLPDNITLFYAKSDKPNNSFINGYIAACDEISNKIFSSIIKRLNIDSTTIIDRDLIFQEFKNEKEFINNYSIETLKKNKLLIG